MKFAACFVSLLVVLIVHGSTAKPGHVSPYHHGQPIGTGYNQGSQSFSNSFASSSSSSRGGHSQASASSSSSSGTGPHYG